MQCQWILFRVVPTLALLLGSGCASNPYAPWYKPSARYEAYEHYKPSPIEMAQMRATYLDLEEKRRDALAAGDKHPPKVPHPDNVKINPYVPYQVSDLDAVNYAVHVRGIFTAKFTNARFARYTSATTQVLLAGAAGVAAVFSGGATVIAGLAFGSAVTPQVGEIFNARDRAKVYQECAKVIDFALNEYAQTSDGNPTPSTLTPAGRTLIGKTTIAIETAEEYLGKTVPALKSAEQSAADAEALNNRLDEILNPKPSPSPTPAG